LGAFFTHHPKGRMLVSYLDQLAQHVAEEHADTIAELVQLRKNVDHIKDIVSMQQNYAKISGVVETLDVTELLEDALRMNLTSFQQHEIQVIKEIQCVPAVRAEKHKVLQILVNLLRNAKQACEAANRDVKEMTLRLASSGAHVRISISDNGVGIPPENLNRIFNHGFTTKKTGHGFGLHSGALAARAMGGTLQVQSAGSGCGATFTLELPVATAEES
jgi:signal transduction histidine kinase